MWGGRISILLVPRPGLCLALHSVPFLTKCTQPLLQPPLRSAVSLESPFSVGSQTLSPLAEQVTFLL